uniref:THAP domain-containing protein 1 n=1 Tax=Fundulus heteroclitus TaxID=8078 RepID=A0A3Q2T1J1_FUNHE
SPVWVLCTCSSRYNTKVSFHRFPVDSVVRRHWLTKILRQDFSPRRETRVCSRHFLPDDLVQTPRGKRCLKKGAIPVLFEQTGHRWAQDGSGQEAVTAV